LSAPQPAGETGPGLDVGTLAPPGPPNDGCTGGTLVTMSDEHIGAFIRSRREQITPTSVGLPEGLRRRTPGLRRAELATLAGISVDYLIRLEQGRDRRPSAQVVAALADAMRLDDEDRAHLRSLTARSLGEELCPSPRAPVTQVRPTIRALLDRMEATPALVLDDLADVVAWTEAYEPIGRGIGVLDDERPNLIAFTFSDPRARDVYPEWERVADEQVANLRAVARPDEPVTAEFVAWLHDVGGEEFTARWNAHPVARKGAGVKVLRHPEVGQLRLAFETLRLPDGDDQRMVVYLPADDATSSALDQLAGRRPGALRAVSSTIA
jgi:transcriptional regulator with XRE-family HTH domain